ncbi:hydrolase [Nannocystis pusilla]|uniref:Hydrolase n=1 Tax=Nannocystis pusilla TaxID=889268 RepID=A0ABS7U007_9BACT|nr:hydrolase [Nannocystis pusilla]MBZ5713862.1 hydrolase [Nannocystis pusilla]
MHTERATPHYGRLSATDAALLLIDHQSGLASLVRDQRPEEFCNNLLALADTAKLMKLPVVLTTSFDTGPNGPLLPEIRERFPKAPLIRRPGEINAWDNPKFVEAVEKTKRKQLILAGITTDVCVAFVALSALQAGYQVFVAVDASGSMSHMATHTALARVARAGAEVVTWFVVVSELMRDWRNDKPGLTKLMREHVPTYSNLIASHEAKAK